MAGARRQLGEVVKISVLDTPEGRLLAALQAHDPRVPLNHRIFPAGSPQGEARGIHLLALEDGQWQTRGLLPLPDIEDGNVHTRDGEWAHLRRIVLLAADLDHDGHDELILGGQEYGTFIFKRALDGTYRELALVDVGLLAVEQLDDDPMPELVVSLRERDDEVWVLGVGTERLPIRSASARTADSRADHARADDGQSDTAHSAGERRPVVRHELAARWQRAEDLNAIGLHRAAVDQLREVAALAIETEDEGRALYRAGQIRSEHGAFVEAGALFARAAATPAVAERAWEAAMEAYLADLRWREAAHAADMRLALPTRPESVRVRARMLHDRLLAPTTRFDLRDGLGPAWRVVAPLQVRTDHQRRGLRVTGLRQEQGRKPGTTPLLALPMKRSGKLLRIAVDFELERIDWAGYFRWFLVAGDVATDDVEPYALFNLEYYGGGGVYKMDFRCLGQQRKITNWNELFGRRLRMEWQLTEDGDASCELLTGGVADRRIVADAPESLELQGPVVMHLEQSNDGSSAASVQTTAPWTRC